VKNHEAWKNVVKDHFDKIKDSIVKSVSSSFSTSVSSNTGVKTKKEETHRTFLISINQVFREKIPENIKTIAEAKLKKKKKTNISDYTIVLGEIVDAAMLVLSKGVFNVDNAILTFQASKDPKLSDIFPQTYFDEEKDSDIPTFCISDSLKTSKFYGINN